jgi:hypothetical protein
MINFPIVSAVPPVLVGGVGSVLDDWIRAAIRNADDVFVLMPILLTLLPSLAGIAAAISAAVYAKGIPEKPHVRQICWCIAGAGGVFSIAMWLGFSTLLWLVGGAFILFGHLIVFAYIAFGPAYFAEQTETDTESELPSQAVPSPGMPAVETHIASETILPTSPSPSSIAISPAHRRLMFLNERRRVCGLGSGAVVAALLLLWSFGWIGTLNLAIWITIAAIGFMMVSIAWTFFSDDPPDTGPPEEKLDANPPIERV